MWLLLGGCAIESSGLARGDAASIDGRPVATDSGGRDGHPPSVDAGGVDAPSGIDAARSDGGRERDASFDAGFDAGPRCPAGYVLNDVGTCYRDVTSGASWQSAEEDCEDDGAHLVVVDSAEELDGIPFGRWIGYSETVMQGTFVWVTGPGASTFAPPWGGTDPDTTADAFCVERRTDGFRDDNCFEAKAYVCEHDGRAADPRTWDDSGRFPP